MSTDESTFSKYLFIISYRYHHFLAYLFDSSPIQTPDGPRRVTVTQFAALQAIERFHDEGVPMGVLASITHHSIATMTGIVERLYQMGFVVRVSVPDDRRIVKIRITEAGTKAMAFLLEVKTLAGRLVLQDLGTTPTADQFAFLQQITVSLATRSGIKEKE